MSDDYRALLANPELTRTLGRSAAGEIEIVPPDALPEQDRADLAPAGILYRDRYIQLVRDVVRFPSGALGTYVRILPDASVAGVCIVPLCRGQLTLIREFRHPTRSWHLQLPRGFAEHGISPADSASRELFEEIGIRADALSYLGSIFADTGLIGAPIALYSVAIEDEPKATGDTGVAELVLATPPAVSGDAGERRH